MPLTIVVPVYISSDLHLDFTRQTLESIKTSHDHEVLVVVNHCEPQYKDALNSLLTTSSSLLPNPKGNILASAWNLGLDHMVKSKSDYALVINNDIVFHPKCIDNLIVFAQAHPEFLLWSASEWSNQRTLASAKLTQSFSLHPHFSCFMVSPKTIQEVGLFDEHFTMGYFEDNDYHTRILQKGFQAAATDSAKFYHYGSRTINVDDDLKIEGKYHYQKNREYFKQKWGVDIHGQAFDPPEEILKAIKR